MLDSTDQRRIFDAQTASGRSKRPSPSTKDPQMLASGDVLALKLPMMKTLDPPTYIATTAKSVSVTMRPSDAIPHPPSKNEPSTRRLTRSTLNLFNN
jgi:hypothetical protein